jgi:flavin-dependent dehydrogenase
MFDPIEVHLGVQVKWGWSPFYKPDTYSPYYYRFAYPLDGAVTLGVYYQLTKRRGHTRSALRRMARDFVAEEREQKEQ